MGYTEQLLDDVRAQLAPDETVLKEARGRRDLVRTAAESFHGTTGSFASGHSLTPRQTVQSTSATRVWTPTAASS
jgi:hypothetical protein